MIFLLMEYYQDNHLNHIIEIITRTIILILISFNLSLLFIFIKIILIDYVCVT